MTKEERDAYIDEWVEKVLENKVIIKSDRDLADMISAIAADTLVFGCALLNSTVDKNPWLNIGLN